MIRKKILSQQGFTLIEVLVSCVIIIALGIGILGLQKIISQTQTFVFSRYLSVDQANSSMQALVKELRTARAGDNGAYPLELADDNEIIFYSDIDFDGETEKIHYWLEGEDFYKGIIEPEGYPVIYPLENKKTKYLYLQTSGMEKCQYSIITMAVGPMTRKIIPCQCRQGYQTQKLCIFY